MENQSFKNLTAYKKAFDLSMSIFRISKGFASEEKYSLTDQIRRSSRSTTVAIAECYRKRKYPAYFISKCSDADMENSETQVWLEFALECEYIHRTTFSELVETSGEVGRLINHIIENPTKYLRKKRKGGRVTLPIAILLTAYLNKQNYGCIYRSSETHRKYPSKKGRI